MKRLVGSSAEVEHLRTGVSHSRCLNLGLFISKGRIYDLSDPQDALGIGSNLPLEETHLQVQRIDGEISQQSVIDFNIPTYAYGQKQKKDQQQGLDIHQGLGQRNKDYRCYMSRNTAKTINTALTYCPVNFHVVCFHTTKSISYLV